MKNLLILHGWFGNPEINWYKSLKTNMEKNGYKVALPQLPNSNKPNLEEWTKEVTKSDFELNNESIIIGHSLGAIFALKLIQNSKVKINHLIIVSGWDFWDLTPEHKSFFELPVDHKRIIENCEKITVIHSTNDPYVTIAQANEMANRLKANFIEIKNGGHLTDKEGFNSFPQLENYLT
jgi:predicted alpha/beta hydrolase family esterase